MKISDPFGRVSQRNHRQFETFRQRLRDAGIRDAGGCRAFLRNTTMALGKMALVILLVSFGIFAAFPKMLAPIVAIDVLILLWLASNYIQIRLQVNRFEREEFPKESA